MSTSSNTDDLRDYEADAAPVLGADNILAQIARTARELREAKADVILAEEALKQAQDRVKALEEGTLPQLMDEAGQLEMTTLDGYKLTRKNVLRANIPEARMPQAAPWLREHGHGSLIRRTVSVEFGPGGDARADALVELVRGAGFNDWKDKTVVNHQSLSAAVREMVGRGDEVPFDLLGVHTQPRVDMKIAATPRV